MTERGRQAPEGARPGGRGRAARIDPARMEVGSLESLDEIANQIGTFRLRLSIAHQAEQSELQTVIGELESRYHQRRAELA